MPETLNTTALSRRTALGVSFSAIPLLGSLPFAGRALARPWVGSGAERP